MDNAESTIVWSILSSGGNVNLFRTVLKTRLNY